MAFFLQSVLFDAGHLPPSEHLFLQTISKKPLGPLGPPGAPGSPGRPDAALNRVAFFLQNNLS